MSQINAGATTIGEQCQLPAGHYQCPDVEYDENRVFQEHVEGAHDGILDFVYITAHPGYDVTFPLLREETQRKSQDLVVKLSPHVPYDTRPDRDHDC